MLFRSVSQSRYEGHSNSHTNDNDHQTMAFTQNNHNEVREMPYVSALTTESGMKQTNYVRTTMAVRRLTARECERLQKFPNNYTLIPLHHTTHKQRKNEPNTHYAEYLTKRPIAKDNPRYKALNNNMTIPCIR